MQLYIEKKVNLHNIYIIVTNSKEKITSMVIACAVTGLEKRVSKSAILKGISKFGSIESFKKHYIDRQAKKLLKQRVSPEDVQKRLLPKGKKPFTVDLNVLAKLKLLKKPKNKTVEYTNTVLVSAPKKYFSSFQQYVENMTETACMRPDIFLNNDRTCNKCPFVEFCICRVKRLEKEKQKR
jgi:hypothetical protein